MSHYFQSQMKSMKPILNRELSHIYLFDRVIFPVVHRLISSFYLICPLIGANSIARTETRHHLIKIFIFFSKHHAVDFMSH